MSPRTRFENAVKIVEQRLREEFGNDLLGLLFAGSAVYGTPMKTSDVDLFVLHAQPWRQRRNLIIEGVEVELFINPVEQIRKEFARMEAPTIDMFARGRIIYDPQGLIAELKAEARIIAEAKPEPPKDMFHVRYYPSDALRDAEDLVGVDQQAASFQISFALRRSLEAMFTIEGRKPPKPKYLLQRVAEHAPDIAADARKVLDEATPLDERVELLRALTQRILEPVGGILLEGETTREPVDDTPHVTHAEH